MITIRPYQPEDCATLAIYFTTQYTLSMWKIIPQNSCKYGQLERLTLPHGMLLFWHISQRLQKLEQPLWALQTAPIPAISTAYLSITSISGWALQLHFAMHWKPTFPEQLPHRLLSLQSPFLNSGDIGCSVPSKLNGKAFSSPITAWKNAFSRKIPTERSDFIMTNRLKQQLDFILEIDQEKNILRQTHLSHHGRRENDAEHAWHMTIMAYLLKEYANEPIDIAKVMMMCLLHDVVEIDAGDTYAYDEAGKQTQQAREAAAKERIYSLLPDDQKQELQALFDEFEARQTPESKFAHAMDNLQPLLLNDSNQGSDWREHTVTAKQVYQRQIQTKDGSEVLFDLTDQILKKNIADGNLPDTTPKIS